MKPKPKIQQRQSNSPRSIPVTCLDDKTVYWYVSSTPIEAMQKMIYYLRIKRDLGEPTINKTETNEHLWFEYDGKTYSTPMN